MVGQGDQAMKIAIVTMVYNERVSLPIWIRHYTRHCPGATLFVVDHGSDDGSTHGLTGVSLVPLPRTPADDEIRVDSMADFQHALLRFHDVVIYTDCDEMLIADPRKHASLVAFLAAAESPIIAPTGLNVHHLRGIEPPLDLKAPILGQRRYVRFAMGACKPSIARVPVRWTPGCHWCDQMPDYRTDLYQFHLRRMDINLSLERLRITRGMAWSERARFGWGHAQNQSDEERVRESFEVPEQYFNTHGVGPFIFETQIKHVSEDMRLNGRLTWGSLPPNPIAEVPAAFFGLI
jgi:hypothetical protein